MSDIPGTAELRAVIVEIVGRSATFEERAAAETFEVMPAPDDEAIAICRAAGVHPNDLRVRGPLPPLFARARMRDPSVLPSWALALERLLVDPTPAAEDDLPRDLDSATREVVGAFAGFVRAAGEWLDATLVGAAVRVAPPARRGLLAWLCRALMHHARGVFGEERRAADVDSPREFAEQLATNNGWIKLLAAYPVLGRLFGTELEVWQRGCRQLVHHLAEDWSALGESGNPVLADATVLALKRSPNASPPLLVTLASGKRVVYHTKDLRIAAWFAELVGALAGAGLPLTLDPRPVLAHADHAWADYISPAPVDEPSQVGRYFERIGMYLGLFQALRTIDMHARNVIVVNEHPVFIDLETVLQPQRTPPRGSAVARAALERFDGSALSTGLTPIWLTGDHGRRAVNVGGLNRGGVVIFPADESLKESFLEPTVPRLGAETASIGAHLPQIIAGYRAMGTVLAGNERVRELIARTADLPMAVLWRSWFLHQKISEQSLAALLLTDGRLRDTFLTRLVIGMPDEQSRTLALHELQAIRDGAAPSFAAKPGSRTIFAPDGTSIPDHFARSALERIDLARSSVQQDRDVDALASAIGCEAQFYGDGPPPQVFHPVASTDGASSLEHAVALADFILGEAVTVDDESLWLGALWLPTAGARRVDVLPVDLLSGSAGLAVMFAYLHRRTGAPRFRDAANQALGPVGREVGLALARRQFRGGAFMGLGAQLYALAKCAELLDAPAHLEVVHQCFAAIPQSVAASGAPRDVVLGASGLLLVAANMLEPFSRPSNLRDIAAEIRTDPAPPRDLLPDGPRWLGGLPGTREGVLWAFARWDGSPKSARLLPGSSLLTQVACGQGTVSGEPGATLEDLLVALAARDMFRDHAYADRARTIADAIVARRRETGRWLDDPYIADRYHLSAVSGLGALALALARIDAPTIPCCTRLVY